MVGDRVADDRQSTLPQELRFLHPVHGGSPKEQNKQKPHHHWQGLRITLFVTLTLQSSFSVLGHNFDDCGNNFPLLGETMACRNDGTDAW